VKAKTAIIDVCSYISSQAQLISSSYQ